MGTVLDRIADATRKRVAHAKAALSESSLRRLIPSRKPLDFAAALRVSTPSVIAEVKLASPSEGPIGKGLDPVRVGQSYAAHGAAALSVLTEPEFFGGSQEILQAIRRKVSLPLLMKDFVLDEYQLLQARASGADAVLLIAAMLGPKELERLMNAAARLGLSVLVEVHDGQELALARRLGARLIGINNRDLKTLQVDLDVSRRLAGPAGRSGATLVCESGIRSRGEIDELADIGYHAFLVGTHLIKTGRPGEALEELLAPRTRIKICGVTRPEDAAFAAENGAWAVGVVFHAASPRCATHKQARAVFEALPGSVERVGVFLEPSAADIRRVEDEVELDLIQIHGNAPRGVSAPRLIRAMTVDGPKAAAAAIDAKSAYLLIDKRKDGPGRPVDWSAAARVAAKRRRTLLAGGLTSDNVAKAIAAVQPWGVDVASGVEKAPGVKDRAKLKAFFTAVRGGLP